jgi:hypothetical protein
LRQNQFLMPAESWERRLASGKTIDFVDAEVAAGKVALTLSKDAERSANEDLKQHKRWLESYAATEARNKQRHERRLKQLRLSHQHWLKRQRMLRSLRRSALAFAAATRSVALVFWHRAVAALTYLAGLLSIAGAWIGRKLQALGYTLRKLLSLGASWAARHAHRFALWLAGLLSISFAWIRVKGGALALMLANAGSVISAWLSLKARDLALRLSEWSSLAFAWSHAKGRALALTLFKSGSVSFAWLSLKAHDLALRLSKWSSFAFAWSGVTGRALAHRLINATSVSLAWVKRKTGDLARSLPGLAAAIAVQARTYGSRGLTLAGTWSEKSRAAVQDLQASATRIGPALKRLLPAPAIPATTHDAQSSKNAPTSHEETKPGLPDEAFQREVPSPAQSISVQIEKEVRTDMALAASGLTKPQQSSSDKVLDKGTGAKAKSRKHRRGKKRTKRQHN